MGKVKCFEELEVFQKARELCKEIYKVTNMDPFASDYRFVQQVRAAAGSIMDNIAEGFERNGNKEFVNFLYIAKGSCGEVRSQVLRVNDVGFLNDAQASILIDKCKDISKGLYHLVYIISKSGYVGHKFYEPQQDS